MTFKLFIIILFLLGNEVTPKAPSLEPIQMPEPEEICLQQCKKYEERTTIKLLPLYFYVYDDQIEKYLYDQHHFFDLTGETWNGDKHPWCVCMTDCMINTSSYCPLNRYKEPS